MKMNYPPCLSGPMMVADEARLRGLAIACANSAEVTPESIAESRMSRIRAAGDISPTERAILMADGYLYAGVAVLPIMGTIFQQETYYNSLYAWILGGTIMERLTLAFNVAIADESVKAVLFKVNSGGGEAFGCEDFSNRVYEARAIKNIVTHVEGLNCSAAYYDSSAASKIYSTRDSAHGSIGTVLQFYNFDEYYAKLGIKEIDIISSVSPDKWPDETTKAGRALYQQWVDELGNQFVEAVARNRGVSVDQVLTQFGKGWIKSGQDALDAGMIDGFASFDEVLSALSQGREVSTRAGSSPVANLVQGVFNMLGFGKQKVAVMQGGRQIGETEIEYVPVANNGAAAPVVPPLQQQPQQQQEQPGAAQPPASQTESDEVAGLRAQVAENFADKHTHRVVADKQESFKSALVALHVKAQKAGFAKDLEAAFTELGGTAAESNFGTVLGQEQLKGAQAPGANSETPDPVAEHLKRRNAN